VKLNLIALLLCAGISARADFSYILTSKTAAAPAAGTQQTRYWLKGQKMMVDSSGHVILVDFDAQTLTNIDRNQKTYTVQKFADLAQAMPAGAQIQVDGKETGQRKTINGFNSTEFVLTMQIDSPQAKQAGVKLQVEMHIWISPDVPGASELAAFYKKNRDRFPWSALTNGGSSSMVQAMATLQQKLANLNGVPVLQTIRLTPSGGNQAQTEQMQQGMAQARARLEEMQKQGGPQAAAAAQALARMGGAANGGFETTMEAGNFSVASIPDSVFEIPSDYQKTGK